MFYGHANKAQVLLLLYITVETKLCYWKSVNLVGSATALCLTPSLSFLWQIGNEVHSAKYRSP